LLYATEVVCVEHKERKRGRCVSQGGGREGGREARREGED
jgi:hypothetical protein